MKYLLDTHVFLWTISESENLPNKALKAIKSPKNRIFVSAVTFWEISIKMSIGKLDLDGLTTEDLLLISDKMDFELINLSPQEASSYENLKENTHKDPFDRMLIWQSICRNLTIISADKEFKKFVDYGLKLFWQ